MFKIAMRVMLPTALELQIWHGMETLEAVAILGSFISNV
jgi:hypothetical protein